MPIQGGSYDFFRFIFRRFIWY